MHWPWRSFLSCMSHATAIALARNLGFDSLPASVAAECRHGATSESLQFMLPSKKMPVILVCSTAQQYMR